MNSEIVYKEKYLKYKSKYLKLKEEQEEQEGGLVTSGYYYVFYNSEDENGKKFKEDIEKNKIKNNDYFHKIFPDGRYDSFNAISIALPTAFYIKNGDTKIRPFVLQNSYVNTIFGMISTNDIVANKLVEEIKKQAEKISNPEIKKRLLNTDIKQLREVSKNIDINCGSPVKCFDITYNFLSSNNYSESDITKSDKLAEEKIKMLRQQNINVNSYLIFGASTIGNYFIHNKVFDMADGKKFIDLPLSHQLLNNADMQTIKSDIKGGDLEDYMDDFERSVNKKLDNLSVKNPITAAAIRMMLPIISFLLAPLFIVLYIGGGAAYILVGNVLYSTAYGAYVGATAIHSGATAIHSAITNK